MEAVDRLAPNVEEAITEGVHSCLTETDLGIGERTIVRPFSKWQPMQCRGKGPRSPNTDASTAAVVHRKASWLVAYRHSNKCCDMDSGNKLGNEG